MSQHRRCYGYGILRSADEPHSATDACSNTCVHPRVFCDVSIFFCLFLPLFILSLCLSPCRACKVCLTVWVLCSPWRSGVSMHLRTPRRGNGSQRRIRRRDGQRDNRATAISMTQRTSRRKRARVRSRRRLARCIPSRSSSPRNNSRRSNPFSSNRQRLSSTGRHKCRVLLSNRRRRRSPHGDTGWISLAARRRPSGKTTKVSLSLFLSLTAQRHATLRPRRNPTREIPRSVSRRRFSFPRCFSAANGRADPSRKNAPAILKPLNTLTEKSQATVYRSLRHHAAAVAANVASSFPISRFSP